MEFTIEIEKYEAGVVVTYNGDEHEIDLQTRDRQNVEFEIDRDDLDEDQIRDHLESIYGTLYMEGEEEDMKEHLEEEGYFVADCVGDAEEKFIEDGKWIVDPDEIDEVDTMEFISEALNKKGFYILKIPSFLQAWIGGSK